MKNYKAIISEKTAYNFGQVIANTKIPSQYKGMDKETFYNAIKKSTCFTFELKEI
jgi:hypothetical protein